jgi:uncharacterized membrane protein
MLNTTLWIAQGFVALVVMLTGLTKLVVPREQLANRMHWAAAWPRSRIKLLGAAEVAGSIGLVVPAVTGIAPFLTPLAAACLAVLMIGAVRTHVQLRESFVPAAIVAALCIFVAAGRVGTHESATGAAPVAATSTSLR